uniref:Ig-like domain-containing protein n=1 Tax=Macrostomum lignano TaxID=282301 RepID=A0A1I8FMA9_9PLAT
DDGDSSVGIRRASLTPAPGVAAQVVASNPKPGAKRRPRAARWHWSVGCCRSILTSSLVNLEVVPDEGVVDANATPRSVHGGKHRPTKRAAEQPQRPPRLCDDQVASGGAAVRPHLESIVAPGKRSASGSRLGSNGSNGSLLTLGSRLKAAVRPGYTALRRSTARYQWDKRILSTARPPTSTARRRAPRLMLQEYTSCRNVRFRPDIAEQLRSRPASSRPVAGPAQLIDRLASRASSLASTPATASRVQVAWFKDGSSPCFGSPRDGQSKDGRVASAAVSGTPRRRLGDYCAVGAERKRGSPPVWLLPTCVLPTRRRA